MEIIFVVSDITTKCCLTLTILVQWQSLGFKKSSDVLGIKRQADLIKPYNSAGEINFHRGDAIICSLISLFLFPGILSKPEPTSFLLS